MKHKPLRVELSPQAIYLLNRLAEMGVYGLTPEEVAGRFVDAALIEKLSNPHLDLYAEFARKFLAGGKRKTNGAN